MIARLLVTMGLLSSVGCFPRRDLQPFVAVSGAYSLLSHPQPPTPVAPAGKCKACNGTGRLGDGKVWTPCQVCGGDGVLDPACKDGQCKNTNR